VKSLNLELIRALSTTSCLTTGKATSHSDKTTENFSTVEEPRFAAQIRGIITKNCQTPDTKRKVGETFYGN
jgi:hypothetical protein